MRFAFAKSAWMGQTLDYSYSLTMQARLQLRFSLGACGRVIALGYSRPPDAR